jgi:hypothetical protein
MKFLKACASGLGVFAAGLLSWLLGWGFFWGCGAALLAIVIGWLITRSKKQG